MEEAAIYFSLPYFIKIKRKSLEDVLLILNDRKRG